MSCIGCQMLLDEPRPFPEPKADMTPTPADMTMTAWDLALTIDRDLGVDANLNADLDAGVASQYNHR